MPDARGYLLPAERQMLLHRYAPVLVLFPELEQQAPYPDDGDAIYTVRGSYHPRAVEFFLQQAAIRYPKSHLLRRLARQLKPRSIQEEISAVEAAISSQQIDKAVLAYHDDPRYTGLTGEELRSAIRTRLIQQELGRRIRGFDLGLYRGDNIGFWKHYFALLAESPPEVRRSIVYGRLIQGRATLDQALSSTEALLRKGPEQGPHDVRRSRVALQYWFHYYYDDWANRHEGDWEVITLLLELGEHVFAQERQLDEAALLTGVQVLDVGYASHEDGYRRLWADVQKTTAGRPIVYIARGSSASYFAWEIEGYAASARLGVLEKAFSLPARLVRGRRVLGRRWDARFSARVTGLDPKNVDWVAADPLAHDRLSDGPDNTLERLVPMPCQGVRRVPASGPGAGLDGGTYRLETENLFWLEMVHEYGVQWGEDSPLPGAKGPRGRNLARRTRERQEIHQLAVLETHIERALQMLSVVRWDSEHAIPELSAALKRLRPKNLSREDGFPRSARLAIYTMWAWILKEHPEAWPGGPGLRLSLLFRGLLYPGPLRFIRRQPRPEPLLARKDPMYHIKAALAQVRMARYEAQQLGARWDNPFAWVRHVCRADTFYYGKKRSQQKSREELLPLLDCVDTEMSME